MGATAKQPTSDAPGTGGSGFYENALNQQKQAVANVPATQEAQSRPTTTPNRPSPQEGSTPGMGEDTRYVDAYNAYMQQHGGSQYPPAQESPFGRPQPPAPQQQPQAGPPPGPGQSPMRRPMPQERPPVSPKGITMGAGYANRPFS